MRRPADDPGGRGLRRAGGRARRSWRARPTWTSCSARRPTIACRRWSRSAARAAGRGHRDELPRGGQVRPPARCRRAAGRHRVPDGSGGMRQVLQLLCRPLYPRRPRPAGRPPPSWPKPGGMVAAGHAGDHPARPKRECLARRGAGGRHMGFRPVGPRTWRSMPRAAPACATPPPTRATWGTALIAAHRDVAEVDALPASAGAIRLRPGAGGDEPAGIRRPIICTWSTGCATARPDLALSLGLHRRATPGETDADFAATMALVRRVRLRAGLQLQVLAPAWHAGCGRAGRRWPETVKDARLQELLALLREQQGEFNAGTQGLVLPVLFTGPGRQARATLRPHALPAAGPCRRGRYPWPVTKRMVRIVTTSAPPLSVWNPRNGAEFPLEHHRRDRRRSPCNPPVGGKAVTLKVRRQRTCCALLFGDHDRNLVRLEQGLGVRMSSRGNRVAISGRAGTGRRRRMAGAERDCTNGWRQGKGLSARGDVDAAIRMAEVPQPRGRRRP